MEGHLVPGIVGAAEMRVTEAETAAHLGSGLEPVFGTPMLEGRLMPGQTSVGVRIELDHLAPTPVGMEVKARAKLTSVDGRRLVFEIEAFDEMEMIGRATHERVLLSSEKFVSKAEAKRNQAGHCS
jgi:fluoroacetyl-CoA thioesterase